MTTIASDLKSMASDSRANGGYVNYRIQKVYRVGDSLVGCTGDIFECQKFIDWWSSGKNRHEMEEIKEDFLALVLTPEGLYQYSHQGVGVKLTDGYHAIGSGQEVALAGLRTGMSPAEAVHLSIRGDSYSGLPVQVQLLEEE